MRNLALAVAGWWVTWAVFGIVAWGGLVLLTCWAFRWLNSRDAAHIAAEKDTAAADLPVPYWPTGKADGAEWARVRGATEGEL